MNDPATGSVQVTEMLFNHGTESHETYHNQYATGMARATRAAFLEAHPEQRPFLLSRSACTGSGSYTAVWTGDNASNYHHLERAIPTTLNLALSGIPFNGPDVGGWAGDVTEELLVDWIKACCLFPFFRIHTCAGTREQTPWSFSSDALRIVRSYIQLRYRLRPYLYQLFCRQEASGEAILRPLIHDYPDDRRFDETTDAFLIGSDLLHAPFVTPNITERSVTLPEGRWYALDTGKWVGGKVVRLRDAASTPLFLRGGAIVPWSAAPDGSHEWNGAAICFLVALESQALPPSEARGLEMDGDSARATVASGNYIWDDGISFAYRRGEQSAIAISARCVDPVTGDAFVEISHDATVAGRIQPEILLPGVWKRLRISIDGADIACSLSQSTLRIAGFAHEVTVATMRNPQ